MDLDHANWATQTKARGARRSGAGSSRRWRPPSNVDAPQILWLGLRRGRCGGRTAVTTAMAAGTTGSARTHARSEGPGHHRRTAGPTGAHAGWKWSREDEHPAGRGTFGTAGTKHAVVMAEGEGLIMPGDCGASEEDDRHDENNAGDDHHPRRSLVEPRRLRYGRRRAGGWRLDLVLGCLGHLSIMPTCAPTNKHRALFSRGVPTALAAEEPGETQNDHGNEHDPCNDRHPRRYLIEPLRMFLRRCDGRRRDGRRRNRRLRGLAHASS